MSTALAASGLTGPAGLVGAKSAKRRRRPIAFTGTQTTVIGVVIVASVVAIAAPYPITKVVLGAVLATMWAALLSDFDERFVGVYVLLLPTLQLAPLETLGVPGLNWQTVFLIIFAVAAIHGEASRSDFAVDRWITYFSIALIGAAAYSWLVHQAEFWSLFAAVKNWLFPFVLFFLGRRCFKNRQQLWFLLLCVAIVSLALALHGLRDALTAGNLLSNRPMGLLTGQANLFAGYLAMYALLFLFTAQAANVPRMARMFLIGTSLAMMMTLVFTLSRGAWLAFVVAAAVVGFATNRRLIALLVVAAIIGSRWAPEEAVTRADLTVTAVEDSGGGQLEETLDDSAALRVIQWKTFPQLFSSSPIWGTGLQTYPNQLGRATGIFRSAHVTMVQIGTEMGGLGLIAYLGLMASLITLCLKRARRAAPHSFYRSVGLGILAAAFCLFVLDFSGTRFVAHTVTTYFWLLVGAFLGNTDRLPDYRRAA